MSNEELKQYILSVVPEATFEDGKQYLAAVIPSEKISLISENLKKNQNTSFDFLFCLTAVDWLTFFNVVYHLTSTKHNHSVVIKAKISDRSNPVIDTVSMIWRTAEFLEREVFDLYGIKFTNHPDFRRILLTDEWVGYPMRKDYVDDVNIVELE